MRPIVTKQNPLRYRLNEILSTEAQVRILRVLVTEADGPLTTSDAARRAGLTTRGASKAVRRLLQTGVILRVGGGRRHQYEPNRSDKLMGPIRNLFRAEKELYELLLTTIRKKIEELPPYAHAAWIEEFPDDTTSPLVLGVLHETRHAADYTHKLRTQLNPVEQQYDLTIDVNGYTRADLPDLDADHVVPLYGVLPFQKGNKKGDHTGRLTHGERDRQLLELSCKIAVAIERDASLVRRAREHVDRLMLEDQGPSAGDISEWHDILTTYSIRRLSRFLTSSSERATRLRQSNPFFAILSADERHHLLRESGSSR